MALRSSDGVGEPTGNGRQRILKGDQGARTFLCRANGRPPLRRAALDTSPPIDGVEEGRQAVPGTKNLNPGKLHIAVKPLSTNRCVPLTKLDSSLAR
ncbi:hypothetical protein EOA13_16415 [Mesorhizobium sp. M7A.F.Ca.US.011.01.1.1]|nr:hypothetical protein EOA13_16415 [Mesorhizobium sp. M7A.F.Ca.US.011.01.1.1]